MCHQQHPNWAISNTDPTMLARQLLHTDYVHATWAANDTLAICHCAKVPWEELSIMKTEVCHDQVKLLFHNKTFHLNSRTNVLETSANQIPCRPLFFKKNGQLVQLDQKTAKLTIINEIQTDTWGPADDNETTWPLHNFKKLIIANLTEEQLYFLSTAAIVQGDGHRAAMSEHSSTVPSFSPLNMWSFPFSVTDMKEALIQLGAFGFIAYIIFGKILPLILKNYLREAGVVFERQKGILWTTPSKGVL